VIGWVRWGYLAQKLHFFDTREISGSWWWKLRWGIGDRLV